MPSLPNYSFIMLVNILLYSSIILVKFVAYYSQNYADYASPRLRPRTAGLFGIGIPDNELLSYHAQRSWDEQYN